MSLVYFSACGYDAWHVDLDGNKAYAPGSGANLRAACQDGNLRPGNFNEDFCSSGATWSRRRMCSWALISVTAVEPQNLGEAHLI